MAYVYRHIRLDKNEPFYIGIGSDKYYKRANSKDRSAFWKRIVAKTEYEVEIMLDDLTWEEARIKEKEFIALYGRYDMKKGSLCNLTDGGDGSINVIISDETRLKRSLCRKGEKNYMYGKRVTEETKSKLRAKAIHRTHTIETRLRISMNNKGKTLGRKMPEEIRLKISKGKMGIKNSQESNYKNSLNNPKSIKLYKIINGVEKEYTSMRNAAKIENIGRNLLKENYKEFGFYKKEAGL
jgi:hypothetical protein